MVMLYFCLYRREEKIKGIKVRDGVEGVLIFLKRMKNSFVVIIEVGRIGSGFRV